MQASEEQLKNRRTWIAALASGEFKQGEGELGAPLTGLCCLGVGCYVLGVEYDPDASYPPSEFCKKVGLPHDEILGVEIDGKYAGGSLVDDNDTKRLGFPQIAYIIATTETLWEESAYQQDILAMAQAEEAECQLLMFDDGAPF